MTNDPVATAPGSVSRIIKSEIAAAGIVPAVAIELNYVTYSFTVSAAIFAIGWARTGAWGIFASLIFFGHGSSWIQSMILKRPKISTFMRPDANALN